MRSKLPSAERFEKGSKRIATLGGPQNVSVISESGLYRLIMRSKIGSAERFEKGMKRIPTLGGPQNISSRVIEIDGEPWFVARDVAHTLGYRIPKDAISAHCKGAVKRSLLTAGGVQLTYIIPEADLYRLIMRSKLPSAERFEKWVVEVVLPDTPQIAPHRAGMGFVRDRSQKPECDP